VKTSLVLTVVGDDRPGIVERVAEEVLASGANWEESSMARLAGKFAGLLHVSVDEGEADDLAARLRALDAGGLTVVVEPAAADEATAAQPVELELVGNDRPGIVRDISRVLAGQQINIEELETGVGSAPMSGETLFRARALLRVPASVSLDALRQQLEALEGELMVDLDLEVPAG